METAPILLTSIFVASQLAVHIAPFFYKMEGETFVFSLFTLIHIITNRKPKISVLIRSYCSGFVKVIIEHRSVFKNFRFSGYPHLIAFQKTSVFACADQYEHFHKNRGFPLCLCTKAEQYERGPSFNAFNLAVFTLLQKTNKLL